MGKLFELASRQGFVFLAVSILLFHAVETSARDPKTQSLLGLACAHGLRDRAGLSGLLYGEGVDVIGVFFGPKSSGVEHESRDGKPASRRQRLLDRSAVFDESAQTGP